MKITGIMIYYYFVCKKKLWYSSKNIDMEHNSEDVQIGKSLDESTYLSDDKHLRIGEEINIDFLRKDKVIHEIKKSKKIEEASIWLVKYYIYYLEKFGVKGVTGKIDYPLLRKTKIVELQGEDYTRIEDILSDIKKLVELEVPPKVKKIPICESCAYYELCWI